MGTSPMFSILMCAVNERWKTSEPVRTEIQRQKKNKPVQFLVNANAKKTSGQKRNELMWSAEGWYIAFVDDDDQISEDYVETLLAAMESGPDVVTFDMERVAQGSSQRMILKRCMQDHQRFPDGTKGMRPNHLCAWKRELARQVPFPPELGYNDDVFWYTPLLESGLVKSEEHCDKILYRYDWNPGTTLNQTPESCEKTRRWAAGGVDFYWHSGQGGRQIVSTGIGRRAYEGFPAQGKLSVRDRWCNRLSVNVEELTRICTVHAK